MEKTAFELGHADTPTHWYNIQGDLSEPLAPLRSAESGAPITAQELATIFPAELVQQETSNQREIAIPEEIRNTYTQWPPSPLYRAQGLERALGTPARIYYKYGGLLPTGSDQLHAAVAQAFYSRREGASTVVTAAGDGQWGSAMAMASALLGLKCTVFMVQASYRRNCYRRALIRAFGSRVLSSPTAKTDGGKVSSAEKSKSISALSISLSEALECASRDEHTKYAANTLFNHTLLHQSIIGVEAVRQFELANDYPDIVIGYAGGDATFGGFAFPFLGATLRGERETTFVAVESTACPALTKGLFAYDFADNRRLSPLLKMYTLGSTLIPTHLYAEVLRYHAAPPLVSHLKHKGVIESTAIDQSEALNAARVFAKAEGILPPTESNYAIAVAIKQALKCTEEGVARCIAFNVCGHGHFDIDTYATYNRERARQPEYSPEAITKALQKLPTLPQHPSLTPAL